MTLNYTAGERDFLNKKLENYLRPIRFRDSIVIPDSTDGRTPFDSDFARIALSAPFRRLQDKTQVHPLPEYDFVRNRLTHSIEVLCIARGLGLGVEKILSKNGLYEIEHIAHYQHAITRVLEAAALVHDIGNPPFGHKIEKTIQKYFRDIRNPFIAQYFEVLENPLYKSDLRNIEGNTQGFRILRHLALAKDEFSYNLTMPTMATIIKYPFSSGDGNKKGEGVPHDQEKFGYLQAEAADYYRICETLGIRPDGQRHPLTYLLEAADDIAYSVCDIEDAYKNGNIDIQYIAQCYSESGYKDDKIDAIIATLASEDEVIEQYNIQNLRIQIQSKMIVECTKTFCKNYQPIINGEYRGELLLDSNVAKLKECCKKIVEPIYNSPDIRKKEDKAAEAVHYLLDGFLEAVLLLTPETPEGAPEFQLYNKISPNYRKIACEKGEVVPTNLYKKFLLVTDYILGMTDHYLMDIYENDIEIRDLIEMVHEKISKQKKKTITN